MFRANHPLGLAILGIVFAHPESELSWLTDRQGIGESTFHGSDVVREWDPFPLGELDLGLRGKCTANATVR